MACRRSAPLTTPTISIIWSARLLALNSTGRVISAKTKAVLKSTMPTQAMGMPNEPGPVSMAITNPMISKK